MGSLGIMVLGGVGIGGSRYFPKAGILHPEAREVAQGQSQGPRGAKFLHEGNLKVEEVCVGFLRVSALVGKL